MFAGEFERRRAVQRQELDRAQWADLANTEFKFDVNGVGETIVGPIYFGRAYERPPLFSWSAVAGYAEDLTVECLQHEYPSPTILPWSGVSAEYDEPPRFYNAADEDIYAREELTNLHHQDTPFHYGWSIDPQFEVQMQWNKMGYIPQSNEYDPMMGSWPEATPVPGIVNHPFYGLWKIGDVTKAYDISNVGSEDGAPIGPTGYQWIMGDYSDVQGVDWQFFYAGHVPGMRNWWVQSKPKTQDSGRWEVKERAHNSLPRPGRFAAEYTFGSESKSRMLVPLGGSYQPAITFGIAWLLYALSDYPSLSQYAWPNLPDEYYTQYLYPWPDTQSGDCPDFRYYDIMDDWFMAYDRGDYIHIAGIMSYAYDRIYPYVKIASDSYIQNPRGHLRYIGPNPPADRFVYDISAYAEVPTNMIVRTIHFSYDPPPTVGCTGFRDSKPDENGIYYGYGMLAEDGMVIGYQEYYVDEQVISLSSGWNFERIFAYTLPDAFPNIADDGHVYDRINYDSDAMQVRVEIEFESPGSGYTVALGRFQCAPDLTTRNVPKLSIGVAEWIKDAQGAFIGAKIWVKATEEYNVAWSKG